MAVVAAAVSKKSGLRSQPGTAVIQPEELDDGIDVFFFANVIRDPSGFRMKVVKIRFSFCDKFFPDAYGERKICQPAPMQVTNFTTADVEENHSTAMRFGRDSRPRRNFTLNLCGDRVHEHHYAALHLVQSVQEQRGP